MGNACELAEINTERPSPIEELDLAPEGAGDGWGRGEEREAGDLMSRLRPGKRWADT